MILEFTSLNALKSPVRWFFAYEVIPWLEIFRDLYSNMWRASLDSSQEEGGTGRCRIPRKREEWTETSISRLLEGDGWWPTPGAEYQEGKCELCVLKGAGGRKGAYVAVSGRVEGTTSTPLRAQHEDTHDTEPSSRTPIENTPTSRIQSTVDLSRQRHPSRAGARSQ